MLLDPPAPPSPLRRNSWLQALGEIAQTAAQALLLYLVMATLIGRFEIHQISMEPQFHEGQRVVVSRWERLVAPWITGGVHVAYAAGEEPLEPPGLRRGQVVVVARSPKTGPDRIIKRLIGLPGDTLEIVEGRVRLNGEVLAEPYVSGLPTACSRFCGPFTLVRGMYFVMGDNRPSSHDSRYFGPVPGRDIVGRVILRYWPLEEVAIYP
jgi:signal peptidase I